VKQWPANFSAASKAAAREQAFASDPAGIIRSEEGNESCTIGGTVVELRLECYWKRSCRLCSRSYQGAAAITRFPRWFLKGSLWAFASSLREDEHPSWFGVAIKPQKEIIMEGDQIIPVLAFVTLGIVLVYAIAQFMWTQRKKRQRQDTPLVQHSEDLREGKR
jgi:hypothetical protein